jgi:membrane protease YdiL (CAAX protease family)
MFKSASTERNPFESIILLVLLILVGAIVFSILAFVLSYFIYGAGVIDKLSSDDPINLNLIKMVQIISSVGMFVIPALVYAKLQNRDWLGYLKIIPVPTYLALLTIVIMFAASPALEYTTLLNKGMKLPSFLKEVEAWMLQQELKMEFLTKKFIVMNSFSSLLVNLLMLAIIPAFGEELIFRGGFQPIFTRWFRNYHVAIWLTAIIFSSIHFQFYGFLPRMFLGALFGYLFVWSGSLWLPILGHFLNNALAVFTAYWYQQQGLSIDKMFESEPSSPALISISLIIFIVSIRYFYRYTQKLIENKSDSLDGSGLG